MTVCNPAPDNWNSPAVIRALREIPISKKLRPPQVLDGYSSDETKTEGGKPAKEQPASVAQMERR